MSRHEFDTKTRAAAWERCGGRCEGEVYVDDPMHYLFDTRRCNAPLDLGCFHYDHIDPDYISGRNDLDNCQVLCVPCHREKTALDQGKIAKVKRIQHKRIKAKTSRNPLPFGKDSKFKKTLRGKVVQR